MKKRWMLVAAFYASVAMNRAGAEDVPAVDRLTQLEQRQTALENQFKADQEKAKDAPGVTAGPKTGFGIKSADGSFVFRLSGDVQTDGRFFLNDAQDTAKNATDTFLLRRARPTFDATLYQWITGRFQTNFGGGAATIEEAFLNLGFHRGVQLRAGRFKPPFGLENLKSSTRLTFIERALPTQLVPIFDQGVQLWGDFFDGKVTYALALTNGAVDGASVADADTGDRKEYTGRVHVKPMKSLAQPLLAGVGLGMAGSTGRTTGTPTSPGLTSGYKTNTQTTFFNYVSGRAVALGNRTRWSPQFTWYPGRGSVLAEYVASRQALYSSSTLANVSLTHRAWQVAASYVLTGEEVTEKGVAPRKPFQPGQGGWGAWEVAGRFSQFVADKETFSKTGGVSNYADPTVAARMARSWTGGLNWYVNAGLKVQGNYEYTSFDGGSSTGNRPVERALFGRIQVSF